MSVYYFSIFLLLILIISGIVGMCRGFVRSIAGIIEYIVAFIVANRCYTSVSSLVSKIPFIAKMITDVEMPTIDGGSGFFEKIKAILSFIFSKSLDGEGDAGAVINNYLAELISNTIAFATLFLFTIIMLKLIVWLVDRFCELPILNFTNKTLGLIFGLLLGLMVTWIISHLFVNTLLPILVEHYGDVFCYEMGETAIVKFFMKFSPMALIMYVINIISSVGA